MHDLGFSQVDAATGEVAATSPHVDDESSSDAALHALKSVISHLEKRLEKRDKQVTRSIWWVFLIGLSAIFPDVSWPASYFHCTVD